MNPNLEILERTAEALASILPEVVFVGGTLTGLLIDDPGAQPARVTRDVDVVAQLAGSSGYLWAEKVMKDLGFHPDRSEGAPTCRWVKADLVVDLMGIEESFFGGSNPWYAAGFAGRRPYRLPVSGLEIAILPAPVFLLTKWEAFKGRGQGRFSESHDIEDLLAVMDGCRDLGAEAEAADIQIRRGLQAMAQELLGSDDFVFYALQSLGDRADRVRGLLEGFMSQS